ncbi:MAG: cytochrome c biogenesis protein [Gemmataceae bacterium]|nr:cytochrome c biogenesis protein [Gemmataceae bacterium]
MEHISRFCFGASYAIALLAELCASIWPARFWRWFGLAFGGAGLLAHTLFLIAQQPTPAMPYGSLLLLAWVLAVFYLYGTLHHRKLGWAIFVLPLVLTLVVLAGGFTRGSGPAPDWAANLAGERFWGTVHGTLILLAAVGVCVGAIASVMYLLQARRLRAKSSPTSGIKLLSLERLEAMNRRAIGLAFPLLTVGLVVGFAVGLHRTGPAGPWVSPKVISTAGLWAASALLMVLRYNLHARGRVLAVGTLGAFAVLLLTLFLAHPFVAGGQP